MTVDIRVFIVPTVCRDQDDLIALLVSKEPFWSLYISTETDLVRRTTGSTTTPTKLLFLHICYFTRKIYLCQSCIFVAVVVVVASL